jgi:hypothetical protein
MANDRAASGRPAIRVSDTEREQVCALLREAFAEGRLTTEEFHDRTAVALAAKTDADLAPLTSDLPLPSAPVPVVHSSHRRELRGLWMAWASMAVLLNAVWLLTVITSSQIEPYWPVWPLGITGALAVVRTMRLRVADEDQPALSAAGRSGQDRADRRPRRRAR